MTSLLYNVSTMKIHYFCGENNRKNNIMELEKQQYSDPREN